MGNRSKIPLYQIFPSLIASVPRAPFLSNETPLFRLKTLERFLFEGCKEHSSIWIKDDGVSEDGIGGNKARKLEFLLADAVAKHCTSVVTFGRAGTNHGLTTLRAASKLGLKTKLVLSPQSMKSERSRQAVEKKLELFRLGGAEIVMKQDILRLGLEMLAARSTSISNHTYWIGPGGSEPLGNLGYVNALLEFAEQYMKLHASENHGATARTVRLFVPVGTAGTLAGLLVGNALVKYFLKIKTGLDSRIKFQFTGVLVVSPALVKKRSVIRLAVKTAQFLRSRLNSQDLAVFNKAFASNDASRMFDFNWVTSHFAPDYGESSDRVQDVIMQFDDNAKLESNNRHAIQLDHTYTGKAMAALFDFAFNERARELESENGSENQQYDLVFWNTYARESANT